MPTQNLPSSTRSSRLVHRLGLIGENGKRILDDALKVVATLPADETITIRGETEWTGSDAG